MTDSEVIAKLNKLHLRASRSSRKLMKDIKYIDNILCSAAKDGGQLDYIDIFETNDGHYTIARLKFTKC